MRRTSAALAALLLAAGCAAMNDVVAADTDAPSLPAALPVALVEAVRADAAQRAGVAASGVRIARAEAVTWRDGSLGCPQPDRAYTMALVPGWRLLAEAGGQTLNYHARQGGGWLHCPSASVRAPLNNDALR